MFFNILFFSFHLRTTWQVVKDDGEDLGVNADVAVVNCIHWMMWKDISLKYVIYILEI